MIVDRIEATTQSPCMSYDKTPTLASTPSRSLPANQGPGPSSVSPSAHQCQMQTIGAEPTEGSTTALRLWHHSKARPYLLNYVLYSRFYTLCCLKHRIHATYYILYIVYYTPCIINYRTHIRHIICYMLGRQKPRLPRPVSPPSFGLSQELACKSLYLRNMP